METVLEVFFPSTWARYLGLEHVRNAVQLSVRGYNFKENVVQEEEWEGKIEKKKRKRLERESDQKNFIPLFKFVVCHGQ